MQGGAVVDAVRAPHRPPSSRETAGARSRPHALRAGGYRAIRTAMLRRKLTMCQISSSVMRPSQASMS